MARKRLYAEGTNVSQESSRAEIERTLGRYGAEAFGFGVDGQLGKSVVTFRANGRMVRFELQMPRATDERIRRDGNGVTRHGARLQNAIEAEHRRLWRSMALAIKAKLDVVESGIATFEEEFLAHVVLPDGSTVGDWAAPQLEQAYEHGTMPEILPGGQTQLNPGQ